MIIRTVFFMFFFIVTLLSVEVKSQVSDEIELTDRQIRALQSLNNSPYQQPTLQQRKSIRVKVSKLKDNQGQDYLGALVSRAELSPYLTTLETVLGTDFQHFRALQAARDHQTFHLTILSPLEYQLADKTLVEKLLAPDFNNTFSSQLNVTLQGLGKVEQDDKKTFFVVAQSSDAQLIRQRFLLTAKDFHVTLGFDPSDIYNVKKDHTTLLTF
ncbi:MAG: hypothetical protein COB83_11235 [Gammaproteobacteria bacterium]|nr:MAG: hypothetical protein COB83_11235 [Gammaproteobacteria bacterium]